ncbi:hypothetical protein K402DRAFT_66391 [Aulographum hederae CBS 113979]|uniref:Uncharacterized protein n=1 Tax=Aulographum hederae CBS 113979 TaxID=1176131 RepID=A0A6G1H1A9_9PEZI|nr:hypothetical protein K402DRAFT_66391 [Aulographum hederae CBS 113979]
MDHGSLRHPQSPVRRPPPTSDLTSAIASGLLQLVPWPAASLVACSSTRAEVGLGRRLWTVTVQLAAGGVRPSGFSYTSTRNRYRTDYWAATLPLPPVVEVRYRMNATVRDSAHSPRAIPHLPVRHRPWRLPPRLWTEKRRRSAVGCSATGACPAIAKDSCRPRSRLWLPKLARGGQPGEGSASSRPASHSQSQLRL